jgi:hypothetical protein
LGDPRYSLRVGRERCIGICDQREASKEVVSARDPLWIFRWKESAQVYDLACGCKRLGAQRLLEAHVWAERGCKRAQYVAQPMSELRAGVLRPPR